MMCGAQKYYYSIVPTERYQVHGYVACVFMWMLDMQGHVHSLVHRQPKSVPLTPETGRSSACEQAGVMDRQTLKYLNTAANKVH